MWLDIILLMVLVICVITDIRYRRIYNIIIFPVISIALVSHLAIGGLEGLRFALLGFIVGFIILIIPYLMGGMGAGDVKLLALIGTIKGMYFVINTALYMAIFGALIALVIMIFRKGVILRLKAIGYFVSCMRFGIKNSLWVDREGLQVTYPYGVAIALGTMFSFFGNGWF